jgi:hypothetical protein
MTNSDMGKMPPAGGQPVKTDGTKASREEHHKLLVEKQPALEGCIDYSEMQKLRDEIATLMRCITDFCISAIQRHDPGRNRN